jgi:DNA-directed RNA polymerase subunit beta
MAQTYAGQKRIRKFLRQNPRSPGNAEPHRGAEIVLRPVPQLGRRRQTPTDGEGIMGVFQSVFPIKDFNETAVLEFVEIRARKARNTTSRSASSAT